MQPVYTKSALPGGRAGTVRTLREMARLSREGYAHPRVIAVAHQVVRGVQERDDVASMRAVLEEVRRRMRYTRDPLGTELVKAPWVMIDQSDLHGVEPMDCDDASVLTSSLLGAVGIRSQFRVVCTDPKRPRDFSHVYVVGQDSKTGRWVPLDPINREADAGWEVPDDRVQGRRENYGVNGLGCGGDNNCKKGYYSMSNRLGNSDFQSLVDAARTTGSQYIDARYGQKKKQPVMVPSVPPEPQFNIMEWIDPFYGGQFNVKAAVVLGVAGFAAYKFFSRKRGR